MIAPRCSPEHPCAALDEAHLIIWGECYHGDGIITRSRPVNAAAQSAVDFPGLRP
jgi:hypothetical protein